MISPLFYILVSWPWGMWDLSSLTRDQTLIPCIGRWSLTTGPPGKSLFPHFLNLNWSLDLLWAPECCASFGGPSRGVPHFPAQMSLEQAWASLWEDERPWSPAVTSSQPTATPRHADEAILGRPTHPSWIQKHWWAWPRSGGLVQNSKTTQVTHRHVSKNKWLF